MLKKEYKIDKRNIYLYVYYENVVLEGKYTTNFPDKKQNLPKIVNFETQKWFCIVQKIDFTKKFFLICIFYREICTYLQ